MRKFTVDDRANSVSRIEKTLNFYFDLITDDPDPGTNDRDKFEYSEWFGIILRPARGRYTDILRALFVDIRHYCKILRTDSNRLYDSASNLARKQNDMLNNTQPSDALSEELTEATITALAETRRLRDEVTNIVVDPSADVPIPRSLWDRVDARMVTGRDPNVVRTSDSAPERAMLLTGRGLTRIRTNNAGRT